MNDRSSSTGPSRDLTAVVAALALLGVVVVVGLAATSGLDLTWPAAPIFVFVVGFLAAIVVLRWLLHRAETGKQQRSRD